MFKSKKIIIVWAILFSFFTFVSCDGSAKSKDGNAASDTDQLNDSDSASLSGNDTDGTPGTSADDDGNPGTEPGNDTEPGEEPDDVADSDQNNGGEQDEDVDFEEGDDEDSASDADTELKEISVPYDKTGLDDVAKNITLSIYNAETGALIEEKILDTEGELKIDAKSAGDVNTNDLKYVIYAKAEGFFTEFYKSSYGEKVKVDLDPIMKGYINGSIFIRPEDFCIHYLADKKVYVEVTENGLEKGYFTTDAKGRFIIDLKDGDYTLESEDGTYYQDGIDLKKGYNFIEKEPDIQVDKPNIYIYPERITDLNVTLSFPAGGRVVKSIPEYGSGWNVTVDPDGTIDGEYGFLFYECSTPDRYQYEKGWVVNRAELETFFRKNLSDFGFVGREIEDFIEWWIPRLKDAKFYLVYPQMKEQIEKMALLHISENPDSILRLFYAVVPSANGNEKLIEPTIPHFEREGFVVTEWGVTPF